MQLGELRTGYIINSKEIAQSDSKAEYIIRQIFKAYYKHPKELPDYILARYYDIEVEKLDRRFIDDNCLQNAPFFVRVICDHIVGMSDQFAAREYVGLYQPDYK